jgi:outer membrane receptor protein involved in Fe transport
VQGDDGVPIAAAIVEVLGTDRRTLSDARGRFLLVGVPEGLRTVQVRRLGFSTAQQEVQVTAGTSELSFQLRYSPLALDELVVTGQGAEISKRRLSTNIEVISSEAIQASPAKRLDQLLQASLPNVQVRLGSGQPGSTSMMRGRGPVSASRSTTPVIYVDGVRVDNLNTQAELSLNTSGNRRQGTQTSSLADIPLENIERIEYIPGGAATTLYGSDAANGVIQIFTSKGAPGRSQFSVETEIGVETADRSYFYFPQTVDLIYRNGLTQQYRLNGSGGNENVTWSFSGSIRDREGFRVDNNASRTYQGRTGVAAAVTDNIRYEGSFSFGWNAFERSRDGNAGGYTPLWLLEGGRIFAFGFENDLTKLDRTEMDRLHEFVNRAEALQNYNIEVSRFQTSQSFRWQPRSDLSFRTLVGLDHRSSNERGIETNEFLIHTGARPAGTNDRGTISNYDRRFLGLTLEGSGQYTYTSGPLSLVNSVGGQLFRNDDAQASRVAQNVRDGSETVRGAGTTTADDFYLTVVNYGAYLQQNWGLYDRYFLDLGLRADGNSAFGDEVGTQYYPKVGLSYHLSGESFFQDAISADLVSNLRLRANFGVAGNFPPPFAHDRTVSFASYLGGQSAGLGQPGNPDLRPEKTHTYEVGAELEALAGRLIIQLTRYDARTRDALFLAPSAPSTGEAVQMRNVGEIQNKGMEFRVSGDVVRTPDLNIRLGAALNTLHNEVVSTGGTPAFDISGFSSSTVTSVVEEGMPVGFLRGSKATFAPDGTIAKVERLQYLGSPLPTRFGSLNMDVTVRRNLRLSAAADWQTGAQMHSFNRQFRFNHGLHDPDVPQATLNAVRSSVWLDITNVFVEDTDFLKVRNISASYTVPDNLVGRWANGLEVGLAIQNPIGWWSSTFDPESDLSGAASQGAATVGGFSYALDPSPRTFLATVRVRF